MGSAVGKCACKYCLEMLSVDATVFLLKWLFGFLLLGDVKIGNRKMFFKGCVRRTSKMIHNVCFQFTWQSHEVRG